METAFDHYWKVVQRRLPVVLLVSAVAGLIVGLVVRAQGPTFEVHFSYLISLTEREPAVEFRYDDYYALSSTDLFATTLAEWVMTPEIVAAAYQEAGIPLATNNPAAFRRAIAAEKRAAQLVTVVVRDKDEVTARAIAQGLQAVMTERLADFQNQEVAALRFAAHPTDVWTGMRPAADAVIGVATFFFALLVLINLIILRESFQRMSL